MRKSIVILCMAFFGFINIIPIHATEDIMIGGESIGIHIQYDGVLVTGFYEFELNGKQFNPAEFSEISKGDRIIEVEGSKIQSLTDLMLVLRDKGSNKTDLKAKISRNNEIIMRTLRVYKDLKTGSIKTGLYVKDEINGIGTISFYNPSNKTYAALGHEIMDYETQSMVEVSTGYIYETDIINIKKSIAGTPGEKISNANTSVKQSMGNIMKNTPYGIYGMYYELPSSAKRFPIATQKEVHLGEAYLYTVLNGREIKSYKIMITKLNKQTTKDIKGIMFKVVDSELLHATNGIVQGMSGSPILQDGKVVGAVTHMVSSKPEMGYGLYIEWMLEESLSIR